MKSGQAEACSRSNFTSPYEPRTSNGKQGGEKGLWGAQPAERRDEENTH